MVLSGGSRGRRRAWLAGLWLLGVAGFPSQAVAATPTAIVTQDNAPSVEAPPADLDAIRAEQAAVVSQAHQSPVDTAVAAVAGAQDAIDADQAALTGDKRKEALATAATAAMTRQSAADRMALVAATKADEEAHARLAVDRARLRGIAVALYMGQTTGLVPNGSQPLPLSQAQLFGQTEAGVVTQMVVGNLHVDVLAAAAASRTYDRLVAAVAEDGYDLVADRQAVVEAAGQAQAAAASLAADQRSLTGDQGQLTAYLSAQRAAVAALAGPASASGGLSLLAPSALSAAQLVAWYSASGYVDFTAATINQLAGWYVGEGETEGVRGDVAFAQAVLETGGFSSPDAVNLNNYAGIGHCDSCASGWAFPSPRTGVLGQLQLLRIYADPGTPPVDAAAPVLPSLTSTNQDRSGCCDTWESLTGVWATDPAYGSEILSLYQQMLLFALSDQSGEATD